MFLGELAEQGTRLTSDSVSSRGAVSSLSDLQRAMEVGVNAFHLTKLLLKKLS